MKKYLLVALFMLCAICAAAAQFNGCVPGFCPSVLGGGGSIVPPPTGDILLVDGSSFILQTDGSSLICRAGGC